MKHLKISIIGCSVAIRIRPPETTNNKNYGQLLLEKLSKKYSDYCIYVNNKAFTRATLKDIYPKIDDVISDYPNYIILNIGIPDVSTREIPRFISNLLTYKPHYKIVLLMQFLYNLIIKPNIKFFVLIRGKRPWVSKNKFEKLYTKLVVYIQKETNAKIIIIPINKPSQRIENILPGTIKNVVDYNVIIEKIAHKYKIDLLNIEDMEQEELFPDGIHYSLKGHEIISSKIIDLI